MNVNSDTFNVEHVLPQNPGSNWGSFTEAEAAALIYRLGNMTLLRSKANSSVGHASWMEKRAVLQASEFELSKRLAAESSAWDAERIVANQLWMAKQAVAIWRIARLS